MTALEAARRLRALGFSIIPLDHPDDPIANDPKQRGKTPVIKWAAFQEAPATDDNLTAWFANGRKRNIGIVTGAISNLVVIDTDSDEAEQAAAEQLPRTPMEVVTAKGRHRYYRHPGVPVPNGARIRPGVDLRGDHGYVVGPGSQHASGHIYHAPAPWPDSLEGVPVFDPTWLGLQSRAERRAASAVVVPRATVAIDPTQLVQRARAYLRATPGAIEGHGGDTQTFRVACALVRGFQLSVDEARAVLHEWNATCVPPWSDRELDAKIERALRYGAEPIGGKTAARPFVPVTRADTEFPFTDTGNAEAFATWHGQRVRFDHRRKRFLVWHEHRWRPDADADVDRLAKNTIRRRQERAIAEPDPDKRKLALKWAVQSESRQRREAMLALARSERPIADPGDAWDRDPWLLGLPNGVVELRTGALRPGRPEDRLTMATAVPFDPTAPCALWERTVFEILNGDVELVAHVQKALGYSLTGITTEQCGWVPYGVGANGKGTLLNTFRFCVGDYGYQMPFQTVLASRKDMATNDLAALDSRRFVLASEVNDGVRFDEARIKALTGADPITARFLYAEFFEFVPVAKFWLATNHKPVVRDDSHGFWRRIRLVPFLRTFPVNAGLAEALKAEAPGIMAWAVRGCLLWQAEGLSTPSAVIDATEVYKRDSDVLGDFLADACEVAADAEVTGANFYRAYLGWAERQGLGERERLTQTMVGRKLSERFDKVRQGRGVTYRGVRLS